MEDRHGRPLALAFLLMLGACTTGSEAANPKTPSKVPGFDEFDLNGIWLQTGNPGSPDVLVRFNPDGSFISDDRGELFATPAAQGTFEVEQNMITFTTDSRSDLCTEGVRWAWRATLAEDGLLRIEHTQEGAGNCLVPTGSDWTVIRLYRPSATLRAIDAPVLTGGPAPDADELAGIWVQVHPAGLIVRFTRERGFSLDNGGAFGNPSVAGTYRRDGHVIRFPDVAGHACPGATFAWRVNLPEDGLLAVENVEEASGDCRVSNGTRWTFIRVSPSSAASVRLTAGLTE